MLRLTGSALLSHHNVRLGAYDRHSTKATCVSESHFLESLVLVDDAANEHSNLVLALLEYPNALVPFVRIRYNILEQCSEMDRISRSLPFCCKFAFWRLSRDRSELMASLKTCELLQSGLSCCLPRGSTVAPAPGYSSCRTRPHSPLR